MLLSACTTTEPAEPDPAETSAPPSTLAASDDPITTTTERSTLPPYGPDDGHNRLDWLADQAAIAALELTDLDRPQVTLDLSGLPVLSDRVAFGLAELGLSFTRSETADEVGHYGTVITVHDDPTATLATWPEVEPALQENATEVRRQTRSALRRGVDIDLAVAIDDWSTADSWFAASSADPSLLTTELIGAPEDVVAWSNREAQRYVADAVEFDPEKGTEFVVTTESRSTPPSVFELPYDSGMLIARERVGWATISTSITLPRGDGLWPAIWLLGDTACDAPGRCLDYETTAYYEIDLLEVRGQEPGEAHLSLHWFDERIRSASSVSALDGSTVHLDFERRPGLLIWRINGNVVNVHTGRVHSLSSGEHNADPMMLIVNTAVGGSFAGEREIGRTGSWLGEALVPTSYPAPLGASFAVHEIRVASR